MNLITNIQQNDIDVSFIYNTKSAKDCAILRKKICTEVYSYTINKVIFNMNTSNIKNEHISNRLGLLIPDNNNLNNFEGELYVKGPKMVMSDDIQNISFIYNMPLFYLDENEIIHCHVILEKDCGLAHAKWNPVVNITFTQINNQQFQFKFELNGLLTLENILNQIKF